MMMMLKCHLRPPEKLNIVNVLSVLSFFLNGCIRVVITILQLTDTEFYKYLTKESI